MGPRVSLGNLGHRPLVRDKVPYKCLRQCQFLHQGCLGLYLSQGPNPKDRQKLVWHKKSIPKYAMILRLIIWENLNAQDKLLSQDIILVLNERTYQRVSWKVFK